ncbi:MAG: CDP-glycerol glycerophosphotransferase family protein [Sneathiella sp.]|nr:CDP-glycerol glycerophosphotransferase family protein [Sneathiella sp.]
MNKQHSRIETLSEQLLKNPDDPGLLVQIADLHKQERKYEEAMSLYFRATKKSPDNPDILENIAGCFQELMLFQEASRYYQAAFDLGKKTVRIINNLVLCLRYCDKVVQSNQLLKKYENSSNLPRRLLLFSAMNYIVEGTLDKAELITRKAIKLAPDNKFSQGILETVLAAKDNLKRQPASERLTIAFHMNEEFHYAIMKPIFDALKHHFDVIITGDPFFLKSVNPSVVFVANKQAEMLRKSMPDTKFVYTRHGLISKNFIYEAARTCDFVCVTSEDQQAQFIREGGFSREQVWLTGYAQMDPLFRGVNQVLNLDLRENKKKVLYAPTFTEGLSSIPMILPYLTAEFVESMGDIDLLIKLHPLVERMQPDWFIGMKRAAEEFENIHLVGGVGTDVVPYLQAADILISDASSVIFQFLALDRPVIAISNPERFTTKEYDSSGIEWRWRDMMEELEDVSLLPEILKKCLKNPQLKAEKRAEYRDKLFGSVTDGRSGERILSYLEEILPVSEDAENG